MGRSASGRARSRAQFLLTAVTLDNGVDRSLTRNVQDMSTAQMLREVIQFFLRALFGCSIQLNLVRYPYLGKRENGQSVAAQGLYAERN